METVIYFMRHSKAEKVVNMENRESLQLQNEKMILSVEGEELAKKHSEKKEFQNIDVVISSHYTRAMATAKYIAEKNKKELFIMDDFGERKFGVSSWEELPEDFENHQFQDENYKIGFGESRKEVKERMEKALQLVLKKYKGKRIVIVSHGTAICFLLMKWCKKKKEGLEFKGNIIAKNFLNCITFQFVFDEEENLIHLDQIR